MEERKENKKQSESYPKPTLSDEQLKNQPEFINEFSEESRDDSENVSFNRKAQDHRQNDTGTAKQDE